MSLELTCKLTQILKETTGTGKNGPWTRQDFLVETIETYPKKICMGGWNEIATQIKTIEPGATLKVAFRVESREYNERWYTDIRPTRIEVVAAGSSAATNGNAAPQNNYSSAPVTAEPLATTDANDDLPF
jgi:hypothetical protein